MVVVCWWCSTLDSDDIFQIRTGTSKIIMVKHFIKTYRWTSWWHLWYLLVDWVALNPGPSLHKCCHISMWHYWSNLPCRVCGFTNIVTSQIKAVHARSSKQYQTYSKVIRIQTQMCAFMDTQSWSLPVSIWIYNYDTMLITTKLSGNELQWRHNERAGVSNHQL